MSTKPIIAFVGMTHLGINYLAASAEKGFRVIGFDIEKKKILKLNKRQFEFSEPGLINAVKNNSNKISFESDFNQLSKCKIIYICPDVTTNSFGKSNVKILKNLIKKVIKKINNNSILIILSQVKPGFVRSIQINHVRLYYQVETLIFGNALERALNPERIIVGSQNKKKKINKEYLNYLSKFKCPIIHMNYESAELAKISINVLLASSITTTNILASACENVSADWNDIVPALRSDERIGKKAYLKPGLGISGGNLERDLHSIQDILKKNIQHKKTIESFKKSSKYMRSWIYRILINRIIANKNRVFNLGIFGLSYKENTTSIKNSPSIFLLEKLKDFKKVKSYVYDPKVKLKKSYRNCSQVFDMKKLIQKCNILIFLTPWHEFKKVNNYKNLIRKKRTVIVDPLRLTQFHDFKKDKYFTIGR